MIRASGHRSSSSFQTYQSAFGLSRDDRDSANHGCWSLVWFTTRSVMILMPRSWAWSSRIPTSSIVPKSGCTVKKSLMS